MPEITKYSLSYPAGLNTQLQYNNNGVFGALPLYWNGSVLSLGVDDTGYDLKAFGATSGKYLLWDESADSLIIFGNLGIGVAAPTEICEIQKTGATGANTNMLSLVNAGLGVAATSSSILFRHYSTVGVAYDAGVIRVLNINGWTGTASTRDTEMSFSVSNNSVITE